MNAGALTFQAAVCIHHLITNKSLPREQVMHKLVGAV